MGLLEKSNRFKTHLTYAGRPTRGRAIPVRGGQDGAGAASGHRAGGGRERGGEAHLRRNVVGRHRVDRAPSDRGFPGDLSHSLQEPERGVLATGKQHALGREP